MRVCMVSTGSLHAVRPQLAAEGADLILFGFDGAKEISYEKELKGESSYFEEGATLSKTENAVVVCGCVTNARGHRRKSAFVAEKGKITGISDMLHTVDGKWGSGAELRVYETSLGKMGVLVAEDLYFPSGVEALAACGCAFIVCPFGRVVGELPSVLLRANAFHSGVPLLLCGRGYAMIADPKGGIAFSSPHSPAWTEYTPVREYHLVERRRRGCFPNEE